MILQLLPDQITKVWNTLKVGIENTLPPTANNESSLSNILGLLTANKMQAWMIGTDEDGVCAVLITADCFDPGTLNRSLLIYSLFGYKHIPDALYKESMDTLKIYAKEKGYKEITAYTKVDRVLTVAESLGWDTSWRYIKVEV